MPFSEDEVARAKRFMKAEDESDDAVKEFLDMAAEYLGGAGVVKTESNKARYRVALHNVALHFYDNRDAGKDVPPLPAPARLLINQLKPYP